jgi:uncharacterized SAM-binding protein YcdF (DUF218 family)
MQIAFIIIGAVVFLSFAVALFDRVLNFGNIAGMALGGAYVALGFILNKLDSFNQKIIFAMGIFVLLLIAIKMAEIYFAGRSTADSESVLIVLGCRVKGSKPSLALVKRVEVAYRFLLANPNSVAILSGGQGRDENLSEALCMQQMLYARGVLKNRLILEDKSTSTEENIAFSLEIIEQLGLKKEVAVATSEYHQKRAQLICKGFNLNPTAVSSHTKWTLLPTFLLREVFGLVKEYFVLGNR